MLKFRTLSRLLSDPSAVLTTSTFLWFLFLTFFLLRLLSCFLICISLRSLLLLLIFLLSSCLFLRSRLCLFLCGCLLHIIKIITCALASRREHIIFPSSLESLRLDESTFKLLWKFCLRLSLLLSLRCFRLVLDFPGS
jgi:hypothetical protein